eukprot:4792458-Lingulodinium_polyedra.AAC.1
MDTSRRDHRATLPRHFTVPCDKLGLGRTWLARSRSQKRRRPFSSASPRPHHPARGTAWCHSHY